MASGIQEITLMHALADYIPVLVFDQTEIMDIINIGEDSIR
jgi:hypothetical protein